MIKTNDVYYEVDTNILKQKYFESTIEEKKMLIDLELKNFIKQKIGKYTSFSCGDSESVTSLLKILSNNEEKSAIISPFIHYILMIVGNLQNYSVLWYEVEADNDRPILQTDEEGKWVELRTTKDTDYLVAFDFVYDIFVNGYMIDSKKLQKKKIG